MALQINIIIHILKLAVGLLLKSQKSVCQFVCAKHKQYEFPNEYVYCAEAWLFILLRSAFL